MTVEKSPPPECVMRLTSCFHEYYLTELLHYIGNIAVSAMVSLRVIIRVRATIRVRVRIKISVRIRVRVQIVFTVG